jgi:hypothetical protein
MLEMEMFGRIKNYVVRSIKNFKTNLSECKKREKWDIRKALKKLCKTI